MITVSDYTGNLTVMFRISIRKLVCVTKQHFHKVSIFFTRLWFLYALLWFSDKFRFSSLVYGFCTHCYGFRISFDFLHSFMVSVRTVMVFGYIGRLVTSQRKCNFFFFLRFIFACYLFFYLYACLVASSLVNFLYLKSEQCVKSKLTTQQYL